MPLTEDEQREMHRAAENTQPIIETGKSLADAAVAHAASEAGRSVEQQIARMGDRFAYQAVEMDPDQHQLDDFLDL